MDERPRFDPDLSIRVFGHSADGTPRRLLAARPEFHVVWKILALWAVQTHFGPFDPIPQSSKQTDDARSAGGRSRVIRIQLGAMDRMLSDIVTDLLRREPDLKLVGRAGTTSRALRDARLANADVILLQDGADDDELMVAARDLRQPAILTIAANGREGWILRFDARRQPIEAEDGGLAAAVRRAAERLH